MPAFFLLIMNEIKTWLKSGRDFEAGRLQYEKYGDSSVYKHLFKKGKNAVSFKYLIEELQKLEVLIPDEKVVLKAVVPGVIPKLFSRPVKPVIQDYVRPSDDVKAPEEVKKLIARRKYLYAINNRLLAIVGTNISELERSVITIELMMSWDEIEQIWIKTNYFDKHSELPFELPTIDLNITSGESLSKRLTNLRTYKSRALKGYKPENLPVIQAEINEIELLIESSEDEFTT